FADAGFDVDLAPMFRTPAEVVQLALDHDVHVVGVSSQAGAHLPLISDLLEGLSGAGAQDIAVVCGGIIPEADRDELLRRGVRAVFTPGTPVIDAIERVLSLLPTDSDDGAAR